MEKALKAVLVLQAVDNMTRVVNKAVDGAVKKLGEVQKKADSISKSAFAFGRDATAVGLSLGAPIAYATNQAIKFEDAMADVAKVMNLEVGSAEFKAMGERAKDAAVYLGISTEEAAGLMASLAQGGVVKSELDAVTKIAGEMGVAFGLGADVAGERFIKMRNALGSTTEQTKQVADAINYLSDNSAAKASDILDFMAAGGAGVANTLKLGGENAAAFGATLISMGKSGAEAATIMERFQKGVLSNAGLRQIFEGAGGGASGLMAVLQQGSRLRGAEQFAFFQQFGEYGTAVMQLSQNMGLLQNTIGLVADQSNYANSVTGEFANRQSTTAGQLKKVQAELQVLMVDLGATFLPILRDLLEAIKPYITALRDWIKANPELTKTILKGVAALAALSLTVGAGSFLFGGITKGVGTFAGIASKMIAPVGGATKAVSLFNGALMLNPITLLAMGIAAVIALIVIMVAKWEELVEWFKKTSPLTKVLLAPIIMSLLPIIAVAFAIRKIIDFLKWLWPIADQAFTGLVNSAGEALERVGQWFVNMKDEAVASLMEILNWFTGLGTRFFEAGRNIIGSIIDGIKSMASSLWETMEGVVQKVRDFLPFSPAKVGPLRDIHRIQLVETIAQSLSPTPLVNAMRNVTAAGLIAANPLSAGAATPAGIGTNRIEFGAQQSAMGGGVSINYSPNITITGDATPQARQDFANMLKLHKNELMALIQAEIERRNRTKF